MHSAVQFHDQLAGRTPKVQACPEPVEGINGPTGCCGRNLRPSNCLFCNAPQSLSSAGVMLRRNCRAAASISGVVPRIRGVVLAREVMVVRPPGPQSWGSTARFPPKPALSKSKGWGVRGAPTARPAPPPPPAPSRPRSWPCPRGGTGQRGTMLQPPRRPTHSQPANTGCRCIGCHSGRASMFSSSSARRIATRAGDEHPLAPQHAAHRADVGAHRRAAQQILDPHVAHLLDADAAVQ